MPRGVGKFTDIIIYAVVMSVVTATCMDNHDGFPFTTDTVDFECLTHLQVIFKQLEPNINLFM
jgi:hypothetical protein